MPRRDLPHKESSERILIVSNTDSSRKNLREDRHPLSHGETNSPLCTRNIISIFSFKDLETRPNAGTPVVSHSQETVRPIDDLSIGSYLTRYL